MPRRVALVLTCLLTVFVLSASAQQRGGNRAPLTSADIDTIALLVTMEDTREFDEAVLASLTQSQHPEIRRRAVLAVGRITDAPPLRGPALHSSMRGERDPEILSTVAFAAGQLKDPGAVAWLAHLLTNSTTPASVAKEAAQALGKIRTPDARVALANYLTSAPATDAAAPVVGEALLSIGRFTRGDDLAPILRWTTASANVEVRWRATWALFRLRDAAAVPHILKLADAPDAEVRFWAMRGLAPIPPPAAPRGRGAAAPPAGPPPEPPKPVDPAVIDQIRIRLRAALKDSDRRVRTEALRALGGYDDPQSFAALLEALESPDTWMSVSAAEALGRMTERTSVVAPRLQAAAGPKRPTALRLTALTPLVTMAPEAALEIAAALARHPSMTARTAAVQALGRLGDPGRARLDALKADPATAKLIPAAGGGQAARPTPPVRTQADYRRIVERWIVPDYNGAPKPRASWTTPKGEIEIELYPGDAPLGTDYFVSVVTSGAIVGTEFGRVVPNFVAQHRTITGALTLRDEVSRLGLTRGNLSWASSGLDTGRPGYTLGNTPQPHNEGDFTALGRVIRGMDVVDRLELGDAVTVARMRK